MPNTEKALAQKPSQVISGAWPRAAEGCAQWLGVPAVGLGVTAIHTADWSERVVVMAGPQAWPKEEPTSCFLPLYISVQWVAGQREQSGA